MGTTANLNWQRVREIFEDALLRQPEERMQYALLRCGDDESLLSEVCSLIDSHENSETFLETPAVVQLVQDTQRRNQLSVGQSLLHYKIQRLIGFGGMGEVYLARDTRLDRNVAIKLLRGDLHPHVRSSERLLREARAVALLEHPNICQIHEISEADGFSFIVMQYVPGTNLDDVLAGSGLDIESSLDIAAQIADGLADAHARGIVHRDIKPANIRISETGRVKILDFGLAKFIEAEKGGDTVTRMQSTGGLMGTVPYMSPEQLLCNSVDTRTDVFSFGSMLFEMVSGVSPFHRDNNGETISAILNEDPDWELIHPFLRPILERCLAKDQKDRFRAAAEIVDALAVARRTHPVTLKTDSRVPATKRIPPATETADANTQPLYGWQSGRNEISTDSAVPFTRRPHAARRSDWLIPITLATAVLVPMTIFFANSNWDQVSPSSVDGARRAPTPSPVFKIRPALVPIPGGTFMMGRDNGDDSERPAHSETVKYFKMETTEITNAEYYDFVRATGYKEIPMDWVSGEPLVPMSPVRFVNISDVNAFIAWRSERDGVTYRLPTEQEWEYGARNGSQATLYPWGFKFEPGCAVLDQRSSGPTTAGGCTNQWGVVDLLGNVAEWTSSLVWLYPGSKGKIASVEEPHYMVRGGSAMQKTTGNRAVTSTWRVPVPASMRSAEIGFRLVTEK
jgi:serine/threonine-protein kinase